MENKKIILAGGSGFLGTSLARYFAAQNDVVILTRHLPAGGPRPTRIRWVAWDGVHPDPAWVDELEGADLVVNLAGRSVDCRYHERERRAILDSRVLSTLAIGRAIAGLRRLPACWINLGSATIYRHATEEPQTEQGGTISPWRPDNVPANTLDRLRQARNRWLAGWRRPRSTGRTAQQTGTDWTRLDFSVEVCRRWEEAFRAPETPSTRRIVLRTAIVLGQDGALPAFRRLARWGLGGRQGTGRSASAGSMTVILCGWWHGSQTSHRLEVCTTALRPAV